jgi:hypothetical protein
MIDDAGFLLDCVEKQTDGIGGLRSFESAEFKSDGLCLWLHSCKVIEGISDLGLCIYVPL